MTNTCALPALWVDLALAATLLAIWFKVSATLSEIAVGKVIASAHLLPHAPASKKSAQAVLQPIAA